MAFIEPMHRNKPNIIYLFIIYLFIYLYPVTVSTSLPASLSV